MSYSINEFLQSISAKFGDFTIEYKELDYNGKIPIFFVSCLNEEQLYANWTKIVDFIAFEFQSKLEVEFQIWNIYIFFIKPVYIADQSAFSSMKLKIENDTFSSRKIVVDENDRATIIDEHIINKNTTSIQRNLLSLSEPLKANELLWSKLEGKVLKKIKITPEASTTFEELVSHLKNQPQ